MPLTAWAAMLISTPIPLSRPLPSFPPGSRTGSMPCPPACPASATTPRRFGAAWQSITTAHGRSLCQHGAGIATGKGRAPAGLQEPGCWPGWGRKGDGCRGGLTASHAAVPPAMHLLFAARSLLCILNGTNARPAACLLPCRLPRAPRSPACAACFVSQGACML